MFLRRIRDIRISIDSSTETVLHVTQLKDKSVKICEGDGNLISHWLLHFSLLNVPNEALKDGHLPEKLQDIKEIDLTMAIQINANDCFKPVRGSDSILFAYLPTKISTYNLPILVNTSFLINASREYIRFDSSWNQWLFSCIPEEMFKWVQILTKDNKWRDKAYELLPNRISAKDQLAERYNQALDNSTVLDLTLLSSDNCLGHELVRDYISQTFSPPLRLPANPFVHNHHRLRNLGIRQFTWDMCWNMLQSPWFLTRLTTERGIIFINYLYEQRESTQFKKRLYDIPFLLDQFGHLKKITEIYFASRFNSADWLMVEDMDSFVHPIVMDWITTQPPIKNWLRKLGIHERTDVTFVEEYLIAHVDRYITPDNSMITITRLFNLYQNGLLTTRHAQDLCRLKLWTVDRSLVPAYQLYFSSSYLPYLALDYYNLDQRLFLCPSYLEAIEGVTVLQWKHFFQFLGIQETIGLIQFNDQYSDELIGSYTSTQMSCLPPYAQLLGFKNQLTIKFLEQTQFNHEFAVLFWDHVMRTINVRMLLDNDILYSQRHVTIENLPRWCVRIRPCIPTTIDGQLLPSSHVFSSHLRTIIGPYLPVFACNLPTTYPELWQQFFQFKMELSIEDYFSLLGHIHRQSFSTPLNDEEAQRIQLIYAALIDRIRQRNYKKKETLFLLSTQDQQFCSSNQLVLSVDKDLSLPSVVPQLKLNDDNVRHPYLGLLLDVVLVRQVTRADLSLSKDILYHPSYSLSSKLRNIQPYLFALAEYQKVSNHSIDCDLVIFEADRLELVYNNEIFIHEVPVHLHHNQLYVKRPWQAEETMAVLPHILCKQLRLPTNFEAELDRMLKEESVNSVDQYFQEQNIPLQSHYFYPELLSIGGIREKFADQIDRDNKRLFSHLSPSLTTEKLLLAALEAQDSKWTGYVYHFTHLENAVTILRERKLKARGQLAYFKDSAAFNVIRGTRPEIKEFVRFYFRPLTPTQGCNENLGSSDLIQRFGNKPMCPIPIFFRFNLRSLLSMTDLRWKVSLGNLASPHTKFDCTRELIAKFDFHYVYADLRTERGKHASQQEFLIECQLDFDSLNDDDISLFVQDENARLSLTSFFGTCSYPIHIDLQYFFNSNAQVIIKSLSQDPKKISVLLNCSNKSTDDDRGKLFVQIKSETPTKTITGNLLGIFQRDNVFTILGKQRITFVPESELLQYAVYYRNDKQMWLIYTNYANPIFQSFEEKSDDAE